MAKFDFQICHPKGLEDDYEDTLRFNLRKISKLVRVCRFEMTTEDSFDVVKVMVELSSDGVQRNMSIDSAVRDLCEQMVSVDKRCHLSSLTDRHIWGIKPLSPMFNAFWTSSFFGDILNQNQGLSKDMLSDFIAESTPYIVPTVLVFGFAVLGGLHGCFRLMDGIRGIKTAAALDTVVNASFPSVEMIFRWLGRRRISSMTLEDQERVFDARMLSFKREYDDLLAELNRAGVGGQEDSVPILANVAADFLQDGPIIYAICDKLCKMSVAASELLILRKDFLDSIVSARAKAEEQGLIWTFASATTGFCGSVSLSIAAEVLETATVCAASGPFAAAGGVLLMAGVAAWKAKNHWQERKKFLEKELRVKQMMAVSHVAWGTVVDSRLVLEWFRLDGSGDPSVLQFTDDKSRVRWEHFIRNYRDVVSAEGGTLPAREDQVEMIVFWLHRQGQDLWSLRLQLEG